MSQINIGFLHSFIYETGQLRFETRHGWQRLLRQYDNVAEHTFRASVIGYLLALMEGYENPGAVVTMILFHDIHEVRIGDTDPYQKRYVKIDEEKAIGEQLQNLSWLGERIYSCWLEMHQQNTEASKIAKDADLLECAYTASEPSWQGVKEARKWMPTLGVRLQTASGKKIFETLQDVYPTQWWEHLSKLPAGN